VPFYRYATWKEWVDAYGPLWEYASGTVARAVGALSRATLPDYILGYRLLAIAMAGLCSLFIFLIVRRETPGLVVVALVAWLWNPLVVISTALGAHNDGLMLALMLVALLCVQRERWLLDWWPWDWPRTSRSWRCCCCQCWRSGWCGGGDGAARCGPAWSPWPCSSHSPGCSTSHSAAGRPCLDAA
jgi:hypothetical protein